MMLAMTTFEQEHKNKELLLAVIEGKPNLVRALLASGADPGCRDGDGVSPLHLAALVLDYECSEILLEGGADVNARGQLGSTALHIVVGNPDMIHEHLVKLLRDHGADPHIRNDLGLSALDLADEATAGFLKPERPGIPERLRAMLRKRPPVPGL